ncbi:MAG: hypothetical protein R3C02_16805 [Planctomycetaceae bacterium]
MISEKQRAQIADLKQAIENSGQSRVRRPDCGSSSTRSTARWSGYAASLDSANAGVNDSTPRSQPGGNHERSETINRIATNTQFGTKKLLTALPGSAARRKLMLT